MKRMEESLGFAMALALVGGFLDGYSFLTAGGVFAGAQTGNTVLLAVGLATADWSAALRYLLPILAFSGGSAAGAALRLQSVRRLVRSPVKATLALEIILIAAVAAPPLARAPIVVTLLLSFAAGLQMATFSKVRGLSYSTTVTTSNYTKWISAVVGQLPGGESSSRPRSIVFTGVLLAFLAGAVGSGLGVLWWGRAAIAAPAVILVIAAVCLLLGEHKRSVRQGVST